MPGPAGTLSRWAPTTTTRSGSPPGVSAITFLVGIRSSTRLVATLAVTDPGGLVWYSSKNSWPTAKEVPTPGMWMPSAPSGRLLGTSNRAGVSPSLYRISPAAPASWASWAFVT